MRRPRRRRKPGAAQYHRCHVKTGPQPQGPGAALCTTAALRGERQRRCEIEVTTQVRADGAVAKCLKIVIPAGDCRERGNRSAAESDREQRRERRADEADDGAVQRPDARRLGARAEDEDLDDHDTIKARPAPRKIATAIATQTEARPQQQKRRPLALVQAGPTEANNLTRWDGRAAEYSASKRMSGC